MAIETYEDINTFAEENFPEAFHNLPNPSRLVIKDYGSDTWRVQLGVFFPKGQEEWIEIKSRENKHVGDFCLRYLEATDICDGGEVWLAPGDMSYAKVNERAGIPTTSCSIEQTRNSFDAFVRYCMLAQGFSVDLEGRCYDFMEAFRTACEIIHKNSRTASGSIASTESSEDDAGKASSQRLLKNAVELVADEMQQHELRRYELQKSLKERQAELDRAQKDSSNKTEQLKLKDEQLYSLKSSLKDKGNQLDSKDQELKDKDKKLESLKESLYNKDQELEYQNQELKSKDDKIASQKIELGKARAKVARLKAKHKHSKKLRDEIRKAALASESESESESGS